MTPQALPLSIFRVALAILFFFSAGLIVSADFSQNAWPRWREILIADKNAAAAHVLMELDGKVYAGAQADLNDLRIVDEQGVEVPSKLMAGREGPRIEARAVEILDRAVNSNGDSLFTLDLGADPRRHNRVEFQTSSTNFSRQVRIETGDDNRAWAMARNDGYIFDFSRDARSRYLEVSYPVSTKRYVRVSVLNGGEKPLVLSGTTVEFSAEQEQVLTAWPHSIQSQTVDQKLRATVILLDLGYVRLPSARIELETIAANYHRHVEIEGTNQSAAEAGEERRYWTPVGSGEIFSISFDQVNRKHLQIDYPEARQRFLRVRIYHYDDRPLDISGVKVAGPSYRLLFRREPGKSYRLYYGNAAAAAPRYDLEQLSSYLDSGKLARLGLGDEQQQSARPLAQKPWFENQPIWMWATLLLAALVLGGLIYRLARMTAT